MESLDNHCIIPTDHLEAHLFGINTPDVFLHQKQEQSSIIKHLLYSQICVCVFSDMYVKIMFILDQLIAWNTLLGLFLAPCENSNAKMSTEVSVRT